MGGYPGFGFPPFGYPWPYGAFPGMAGGAASPGGTGAQQRFQGRIKSFNQEKGYGFIESAGQPNVWARRLSAQGPCWGTGSWRNGDFHGGDEQAKHASGSG